MHLTLHALRRNRSTCPFNGKLWQRCSGVILGGVLFVCAFFVVVDLVLVVLVLWWPAFGGGVCGNGCSGVYCCFWWWLCVFARVVMSTSLISTS